MLLKNKTILISGVANERSLAWGVAKAVHKQGAELIFTYRKERSRDKLMQLLEKEQIPAKLTVSCDMSSDESIAEAFRLMAEEVKVLHGVVHSVAFADKEGLQGDFMQVSREGYHLAQDSSAYSFVALAKAALPLMKEGGSIVTQTYLGAERVVKNYNMMGVAKAALEASMRYLAEDMGKYHIRVNAISAGPVRTLAAKGVSGFNDILSTIEEKAPLRRNVNQDEIGDATMFLLSDLARGITGEVIHVDAGYHIIG